MDFILFTLALVSVSNALTLEEAKDLGDDEILKYHLATFDIGFHAAMACGVVYGSLVTTITMLSIVIRHLVRLGWITQTKRS